VITGNFFQEAKFGDSFYRRRARTKKVNVLKNRQGLERFGLGAGKRRGGGGGEGEGGIFYVLTFFFWELFRRH